MEALHPWVAYGVLPLFAFAAAGFSFKGLDAAALLSPVALGVALALLLGKPLGVFGVTAGAALLRLGRRPAGATWLELYGVAQLTGVGFTMSLYLAALAFETPLVRTQARLGVFAGSLASIAVGAGVLAIANRRREAAGRDFES
jgi:NhaA family Na+:H+ antiporter